MTAMDKYTDFIEWGAFWLHPCFLKSAFQPYFQSIHFLQQRLRENIKHELLNHVLKHEEGFPQGN